MLRLAIIIFCALIIHTDIIVKGYTVSSRNRDYTGGYSTTGFVGLSRDSSGSDLSDQLSTNGGYAAASSRYATLAGGGQASPGASYSSSGYSDSAQSSGYPSHTSTAEALSSVGASYTADGHSSADVSSGYTAVSPNPDHYATAGSHGSSGYLGYSSSQSSPKDHSGVEYASSSSSSYPGASSLNNLVIGSPKAAAYTASGGGHGHSSSQYSPGASVNYVSSSHPNSFHGSSHSSSHPSSHLSSYPGGRPSSSSYPGPAHSSFPDGLRFSPGASLSNYLGSGGPSNFVHSNGGLPGHRGIPPFMLGAASNASPSFVKGSAPFYPGGFLKSGGNKFIIIKDGPGGHPGMMHPAEPNFPSRMFGGGSSGFKVRSAGPFSAGPHFAPSNFISSHSSGFPGRGGHHAAGHAAYSPFQ